MAALLQGCTRGAVAACRPAASAKPRAAAAHGAGLCACCPGFALRGTAAPLSAALPRAAAASRNARLSVVAAAAATDAPVSGLNMKGNHVVPPSAGPNPTWQAIIEVGGSQQIVSAGRFYSCHSLPDAAPGQKIVFERVLATKGADASLSLGRPYVKGAKVHAQVLEHFKDKKIIVFKMKAKKHYRKKMGHRQSMTRFLVTEVQYAS